MYQFFSKHDFFVELIYKPMKKFSLKRFPSMKSEMFNNPILVYLVIFLSVFNVLGYIMMRKPVFILCFVIVGAAIYRLSKSIFISLASAILLTNLLLPMFLSRSQLEGMENQDGSASSSDDKKAAAKAKATDSDAKAKADAKKTDAAAKKADAVSSSAVSSSAVSSSAVSSANDTSVEPLKSGNVKNGTKKPRIDYASTVKDAYSNLTDMLGPGGIQGLTKDTRDLVKEQSKLTDAMNNMQPLLENAKSLLKNMDMGNLKNMMEKFGGA